ncbi:hypothetical protein [Nocardia sp. IFM 10818]
MKCRLRLTLTGPLDQTHLDVLRQALLLSATGAATDPVGTELGTRGQGTSALPEYGLKLWRSGDDEWSLVLEAIPSLPITRWQGLIKLGVRAAGLTIREAQEFPGQTHAPALTKTAPTTARPAPPPAPRPVPEGVRKPDWAVLEPDEIMALAAKLVSLDPAWRFDPDLVARAFGWPIRKIAPNYFQLDTGPHSAKGYLWAETKTQGLEVPISMPVPDDDELRLGYVFTLLSPTLHMALGESALPPSTRTDEVTWGNDIYRLNLVQMPTDIRMFLTPKGHDAED